MRLHKTFYRTEYKRALHDVPHLIRGLGEGRVYSVQFQRLRILRMNQFVGLGIHRLHVMKNETHLTNVTPYTPRLKGVSFCVRISSSVSIVRIYSQEPAYTCMFVTVDTFIAVQIRANPLTKDTADFHF